MALYIRVQATRYHNVVDLVTDCGVKVVTVYDGNSRVQAFQAVTWWRGQGYTEYRDCAAEARQTSGGNGNSRYLISIGRFDRWEERNR